MILRSGHHYGNGFERKFKLYSKELCRDIKNLAASRRLSGSSLNRHHSKNSHRHLQAPFWETRLSNPHC